MHMPSSHALRGLYRNDFKKELLDPMQDSPYLFIIYLFSAFALEDFNLNQ